MSITQKLDLEKLLFKRLQRAMDQALGLGRTWPIRIIQVKYD